MKNKNNFQTLKKNLHSHWLSWHHPLGYSSSAAPIDLHDLAWHHLVITCVWHFLAPLSAQTTEPKGCAAANFSGVICTDEIHWQLNYFYTKLLVEGDMVVVVVTGLSVIGSAWPG